MFTPQDEQDDITIQTYFTHASTSNANSTNSPKKSLRRPTESSTTESSMQTPLDGLKEKIAKMQDQLRVLTMEAKESQGELHRMRSAREKRTQRLKVNWQSKLDGN